MNVAGSYRSIWTLFLRYEYISLREREISKNKKDKSSLNSEEKYFEVELNK